MDVRKFKRVSVLKKRKRAEFMAPPKLLDDGHHCELQLSVVKVIIFTNAKKLKTT